MDCANHALAGYLARTGQSVELVAHRVAQDLTALPGVTVRVVPKPLGSYLLGRWPLAWTGRRAGRARQTVGGRVVVNGGNCPFPDVNWVHYVHAACRSKTVASWPRRLKSRVEHHLDLRAERIAVRTARVVVCNSNRTRRDVIERLGVHPDRAVTVYYGCDPGGLKPTTITERVALRTKLGWPTDRPVVMFVGALGDRRKGFDTVFDAWQQLSRSADWDVLLAVVGQGTELSQWERRVADANLVDRVRFLGFRTDVPDLLRAADALVSPTRYEAYGLSVHEAICCGLPALVSTDAGVAERYPPDLADLLLPNPDDADELVAHLRHWRVNIEGWAARVRPMSDRLRTYGWADMAHDFLARCV
ncbi:MAG: glycosyltransferase family 4 protein [Planctomycetes bacterium]|nr:glycosyltransferase family 4 protein [Planctomycetota bacterium]